jgi:hypothetical protein
MKGQDRKRNENKISAFAHTLNLIFQEIRAILGSDLTLSIPLENSKSSAPAADSDIHLSPVHPVALHRCLAVLHFCVLRNDPTEPAKPALNGKNQVLNGAQKRRNPSRLAVRLHVLAGDPFKR